MKQLILASQSPRRKKILRRLNIPFIALNTEVDETIKKNGTKPTPEEIVLLLSKKKADAAAKKYPEHFILGVDTLVVIDGNIMGKPKNEKEAVEMLKRLNGRWHKVITGITLINKKENYEDKRVVETEVKFFNHTEDFIRKYVAKGESLDKAGGYGIQSDGKSFVDKIRGDFSNVVGLPEKTLLEMLKEAGIHPIETIREER